VNPITESPLQEQIRLGTLHLRPGQPILASPVFWHAAAHELPDDGETVLIYLAQSGEMWTGYYDSEVGVWRFVTGDRIDEPVLYWARFPAPPIG
jgi:hypothetical protein